MGKDRIDLLSEAMQQSAMFDEDAAYLKRGQPYSADSDDVLKQRWIEYFKKLVDRNSESDGRVFSDCTAELRRRGVEEPIHEVGDEFAKLQDQFRENPDDPGVLKAVNDFMKKLRKPDA
jgi:hypothetical protein